jgi:alpha-glucosidase
MLDGNATFRGELGIANASVGASTVLDNVEKRMGWRGGVTTVGSVGKAIQTMGMARVRLLFAPGCLLAKLSGAHSPSASPLSQATYEALLAARPHDRPVIVSRSGAPGIQAFAHATWSGDNSTTWKALKWGTKMTLSVGMSFGPGLYGHDIVRLLTSSPSRRSAETLPLAGREALLASIIPRPSCSFAGAKM